MSERKRRGVNSKGMNLVYDQRPLPTSNYTLATVCPQCGNPTFKLACKVRCGRCGFMWDCSEL